MTATTMAIFVHGWHHGWGGGWWWVLFPLMWAALIAGVVWIARSSGGWRRFDAPPETALDILERRFARGEIDADEYRARRETLGG